MECDVGELGRGHVTLLAISAEFVLFLRSAGVWSSSGPVGCGLRGVWGGGCSVLMAAKDDGGCLQEQLLADRTSIKMSWRGLSDSHAVFRKLCTGKKTESVQKIITMAKA